MNVALACDARAVVLASHSAGAESPAEAGSLRLSHCISAQMILPDSGIHSGQRKHA
ncbi:hypothetical protein [Pantoea anthophila]|uniref:hypothetical protein n=1 Tax=Pantoea anthophila TaxID=470931 RepID=UPI00301D40DF